MKNKVKNMRLTKAALTKNMKIRLIMTLMSVRKKTSLMYEFTKVNEQNLKP